MISINYTEEELPAGLVPEKGETIEVTHRNKFPEPLLPYNIMGNGFTNRHGTSMDAIDICAQLNTSEIKLLQFLRDQFTLNSIRKEELPSVVRPTRCEGFTDYLKTALRKNYAHLEYVGVLRRLKRGEYIINPGMLMPSRNYLQAMSLWNSTEKDEEDGI